MIIIVINDKRIIPMEVEEHIMEEFSYQLPRPLRRGVAWLAPSIHYTCEDHHQ